MDSKTLESQGALPGRRFVIALHSPDGADETGLHACPSEKMAENFACGVQRDTFSGPVSERDLRNCGVFARFYAEYTLVSLQPRLNGGEGGIRTLGPLSIRANPPYR